MAILPGIDLILLILALSKESDMDDIELSIAIRNGDRAAFETFFNRHYDSLYRFLVSRNMNHDEARDLVQRAFIMIWEKRGSIDETKSLRSYLFTIAYSRMLNHIEYQSKFKEQEVPEEHSTAKSTEESLDHKELLRIVRKIISSMPEKRGMVFELCFMKEFTYKEAADAMDVSPKTIENHMALAFKDLRHGITEIYGKDLLKTFNLLKK
ncbi:RNA polymerase sigma factor [Rhodohalobacter barkolensis]|uniref:RNA polymerase sigma-70 factor n=1 Tax=Rhodohalobacter barkolensis TaxID=2053187 RepID=A0A2N0VIK0_9BACT|nr:RNA polymerase sigma-70 factor [Rhodohalobacter barkolensis]PKD43994.1 RNA polymerase sigma-70 factor [Rhodohalobacter barkolensis]